MSVTNIYDLLSNKKSKKSLQFSITTVYFPHKFHPFIVQ